MNPLLTPFDDHGEEFDKGVDAMLVFPRRWDWQAGVYHWAVFVEVSEFEVVRNGSDAASKDFEDESSMQGGSNWARRLWFWDKKNEIGNTPPEMALRIRGLPMCKTPCSGIYLTDYTQHIQHTQLTQHTRQTQQAQHIQPQIKPQPPVSHNTTLTHPPLSSTSATTLPPIEDSPLNHSQQWFNQTSDTSPVQSNHPPTGFCYTQTTNWPSIVNNNQGNVLSAFKCECFGGYSGTTCSHQLMDSTSLYLHRAALVLSNLAVVPALVQASYGVRKNIIRSLVFSGVMIWSSLYHWSWFGVAPLFPSPIRWFPKTVQIFFNGATQLTQLSNVDHSMADESGGLMMMAISRLLQKLDFIFSYFSFVVIFTAICQFTIPYAEASLLAVYFMVTLKLVYKDPTENKNIGYIIATSFAVLILRLLYWVVQDTLTLTTASITDRLRRSLHPSTYSPLRNDNESRQGDNSRRGSLNAPLNEGGLRGDCRGVYREGVCAGRRGSVDEALAGEIPTTPPLRGGLICWQAVAAVGFILANVIIMGINWGIHFFKRHIDSLPKFFIGVCLASMGALSWSMENERTYWLWHSIWHLCIQLCPFFIVSSLPPPPPKCTCGERRRSEVSEEADEDGHSGRISQVRQVLKKCYTGMMNERGYGDDEVRQELMQGEHRSGQRDDEGVGTVSCGNSGEVSSLSRSCQRDGQMVPQSATTLNRQTSLLTNFMERLKLRSSSFLFELSPRPTQTPHIQLGEVIEEREENEEVDVSPPDSSFHHQHNRLMKHGSENESLYTSSVVWDSPSFQTRPSSQNNTSGKADNDREGGCDGIRFPRPPDSVIMSNTTMTGAERSMQTRGDQQGDKSEEMGVIEDSVTKEQIDSSSIQTNNSSSNHNRATSGAGQKGLITDKRIYSYSGFAGTSKMMIASNLHAGLSAPTTDTTSLLSSMIPKTFQRNTNISETFNEASQPRRRYYGVNDAGTPNASTGMIGVTLPWSSEETMCSTGPPTCGEGPGRHIASLVAACRGRDRASGAERHPHDVGGVAEEDPMVTLEKRREVGRTRD
eukprot:GHVN01003460.1.p1 GENE.GHVN01003460.1~~GHVN01003460.1.p1  ORF type:complete len:1136 (-),score=242.80 GHVN01003460.1:259-3396(-)